MASNDHLPDIIRQYREEKRLTQEQLSQMIHKSDKYIGSVECGRITPPYSVLRDIVHILDIDGNAIFYGTGNSDLLQTATLYLNKMDPDARNLAVSILRTIASNRKDFHTNLK